MSYAIQPSSNSGKLLGHTDGSLLVVNHIGTLQNNIRGMTNFLIMGFNPDLLNGGFENAGGGGADVFADWQENAAGGSVIADDVVTFHDGAHSCRLQTDAGGIRPTIFQNGIIVSPGTFLLSFWGIGNIGGEQIDINVGNHTWNVALSNVWTEYALVFNPSAGTQVGISGGNVALDIINIDSISLSPY
jgi:hypothetical protein